MNSDNHNADLQPASTTVHPQAESFWLPGGPTGVLLIHGYGGSIGDYRELAADLQHAGYSVRGVRLAGHGGTPAELAAAHIPDWRESVFLAARMVKRDCQQVILFGVSFGGALALDYAVQAPDQVKAVVTVNTPMENHGLRPLQRLLLRMLRLVTPYLRKFGLSEADRQRMQAIGSLDRWPIDGIFETMTFARIFVRPGLPRLQVPTLIFRSDDDPYVDPASSELLLSQLGSPSKALVRLETHSHRPLRDPKLRQVVVARMQEFLKPLA